MADTLQPSERIDASDGWAHAKLEASATYQEVKASVIELRSQLRKHKEHWLKRKFRASIAVAKNKV